MIKLHDGRLESSGEDFDRRFEEEHRELLGYLRGRTRNFHDAEDVAQETWAKVHTSFANFDPTKRFRPWLYAIASNAATDRGRRNKRHQTHSLDHGNIDDGGKTLSFADLLQDGREPLERILRSEHCSLLRDEISKLPDRQREAICDSVFEGLSPEKISTKRGIPLGTVKSHIRRAKLKIRDALAKYMESE